MPKKCTLKELGVLFEKANKVYRGFDTKRSHFQIRSNSKAFKETQAWLKKRIYKEPDIE